MPIRFRRTFKILPGVKINMSKGGISSSIGFRGFHINIGKHGIRQTIGLPGSGLSESSYLVDYDDDSKKKKDKEPRARRTTERASLNEQREDRVEGREEDEDGEGCAFWVVAIFLLVVIGLLYWAGSALGWIPPHFLSNLMTSMAEWVQKAGH